MGVEAIVIGNFISTFICYFINAYLPGKMFNFGIKAQFRIFWKIVIATAIMASCVLLTMRLFDSNLMKLIIGILTGILTYLLSSFILRIKEMIEVFEIAFSRLHKR